MTYFKYTGKIQKYKRSNIQFRTHGLFKYDFVFKKMRVVTYHITVSKLLRIVLQQYDNDTNYILIFYDGPKDSFSEVKMRNNYIIFSSFQCYVKLYQSIPVTQLYPSLTINVHSIQQDIMKYSITNYTKLSLTNFTKKINHIILNISTTKGYLNLSIQEFSFYGPNIDSCVYGGSAYFQTDDTKFKEIITLCNNYTHLFKYKFFNKTLMDFITTNPYILVVVYFYKPVSIVSNFSLEVSISSCRGIFPCATGGFKQDSIITI